MAKLPESFIDNLLSRVDLVEIIGSRVPLKKQGKDYSARCPFHDERSPSFTVSPSKQFYYCFGCGAKGTAISFLMNYDRLTFMDAVEDLAKRAGIEIPKDARQHADADDGKDLYAALDASSQFFQKQLAASDKAKSYLGKRGVDAKSTAQFAIGYAPEGFNGLIDALGTDERRKGLLEKTGMLSKSDNGRVYDKFRGRVMFPIFDRRGRVIAFGGRVLEKDDGPKYLNSPETPLFHKGRELYGLWQVKQAHSKIPRLIVVEGYMDVVSLFQHGIREAVATLGTATTPDHAELLFRNSADVVFCFDGDKAGRAAAWKAVESIIPRMRDGRQAFFLFLPEGEDPDTIVKTEGAGGFEARVQNAMTLSDYFFDELGRNTNLNTLEGKARLAEKVKPYLEKIPDGAFRDLMTERLLGLTGVVQPMQAAAKAPQARTASISPKRSLIRAIITLLLQNPKLGVSLPTPLGFEQLDQPGVSLLLELLELIRSRPEITSASLLEAFEQHADTLALQKLVLLDLPGDEASLRQEFSDALEQLQKQYRQQRLNELRQQMAQQGLSEQETNELRELLLARG
jgi:DNA primase